MKEFWNFVVINMVASGLGLTMVVKVVGGIKSKIRVPFLDFQNPICSNLIHEVLVFVTNLQRRDVIGKLLIEYFKEPCMSFASLGGRTEVRSGWTMHRGKNNC